ncbi:hypothetical protein ACJX0J_023541, partial [Zea mays]
CACLVSEVGNERGFIGNPHAKKAAMFFKKHVLNVSDKMGANDTFSIIFLFIMENNKQVGFFLLEKERSGVALYVRGVYDAARKQTPVAQAFTLESRFTGFTMLYYIYFFAKRHKSRALNVFALLRQDLSSSFSFFNLNCKRDQRL